MKKIAFLILIITLANCGVQKKKITEKQKIQKLTDSLNYTVFLPENWAPILDSHSELSYSPKNLGDLFYKNIIQIYRFKINENTSLSAFVEKNINNRKSKISITSQNMTSTKTKYGETYVYSYEHHWNFTQYKVTATYFIHHDHYYIFNYSSDKKFYEKYMSQADFIFDNLKFNE